MGEERGMEHGVGVAGGRRQVCEAATQKWDTVFREVDGTWKSGDCQNPFNDVLWFMNHTKKCLW